MANEALQTIKDIVKDFANLEIVTMVGNIEVKKEPQTDGSTKVSFEPEAQTIDKGCITTINLVDGDIRNYIGKGLTGEEYDRVVEFHTLQVEKAREVIQGTITALKEAAQLIKELSAS